MTTRINLLEENEARVVGPVTGLWRDTAPRTRS